MGETRFLFPVDGDMLNSRDGAERAGRLYVTVRAAAPPHDRLYVNNTAMAYGGGVHTAEIPLDGYRNTLTLYNADSRETAEVVVFWMKDATERYRFSLDDNIWCLRDLAKNAGTYKSAFDNPYFAIFKKANELYGTKVLMNIYYQCDGFDLTMMPDTYKEEFQANSDWFRFSFHAKQNDPPSPYKNTSYDNIAGDYDAVIREIRRFAGQENIPPVTTIHYGECTREGVRALRARGIRCLIGWYQLPKNIPYVSYYFDLGQTLNIRGRNFWRDNREDMVFGRITSVLNLGKLHDIRPFLEAEKSDPHKGGFMELMIHEQYFYPDYVIYLPDFEERVLTGIRWAHENGYRPSWIEDFVFEP
jgi:hypothetical protein